MTIQQRRFAEQFVLNVFGSNHGICSPELLATAFNELSRKEEVENHMRDHRGNWDHTQSVSFRCGRLYTPWLDRALSENSYNSRGRKSVQKRESVWPENKSFALCLTHDVDVVSRRGHLRRFSRRLRRALRSSGPRFTALYAALGSLYRFASEFRQPDTLGHYEDWLNLEDRFGFRSTFYFAPEVSHEHIYDCEYTLSDIVIYDGVRMTVSEMMRRINSAGWEIGLHGSYMSAYDTDLIVQQKQIVEEAVGNPVMSVRQHYLRYDVKITPKLQAHAGLLCDSTQGFNRSSGFRAGTCFPYYCWDHDNGDVLPLLEIPLHIMDSSLFSDQGIKSDSEKAIAHCISLMDAVEHVGGCLTLNWHPNYLNNEVYWNTYSTLLSEASRRNAWGCSARQLFEWWTAREQSLRSVVAAPP